MSEERIERIFETGMSAEVNVSNVEGSIEIQGWDRPEVQIVAVKHGDDGRTTVEIDAEGAQVWARTRTAEGVRSLFGWLRRSEEVMTVHYTARVPYGSTVAAIGISGPIHVVGIENSLDVHSVNGNITLEDLAGDISAATVNSSIEGRRLDGELAVETVSGQVELLDSRLTIVKAQSVDGSIRATGQIDQLRAEAVNGAVHLTSSLHPEGQYSLKTVNGSFHLAVPPDTACDIDAEGLNVDVACELPNTVEEQRWGSWSGRVNDGGGAQIKFNTVNGTLRLTAEEAPVTAAPEKPIEETAAEPAPAVPEPPAEPTPPTPESPIEAEPAGEEFVGVKEEIAPSFSKMDVLKAVERGELTVEQALEHLRSLDRPTP